MASWRRKLAQRLGAAAGTTGSWARRYAEGLGAPARGPWMRAAVEALGGGSGPGPWDRMLQGSGASGSWARRAYTGGGGPIPAWVEALRGPSGDLPLVAINGLLNEGWNGASVALDSLVTLNGATITADGILPPDVNDPPIELGAAFITAMGEPFTIVHQYKNINGFDRTFMATDITDVRTATTYLDMAIFGLNSQATTDAFTTDAYTYMDVTPSADDIVRLALNVSATAAQLIAANGVTATDNGVDGDFVPALPTVNYAYLSRGLNGSVPNVFTQIFAVYALQPDADLPALSALPGPDVYTTGAVAFDGSQYLVNSAPGPSSTPYLSYSFWFAEIVGGTHCLVFVVDPDGNYTTEVQVLPGSLGTYLGNAAGNAYVANVTDVPVDLLWHHVLFSGETDQTGTNICKTFVDGVDVSNMTRDDGPLAMAYDVPFWIGSDDFLTHLNGNVADMWIAPGQSLIDGSGTIPPETIAKFYNAGKPVDLGADGSTPTGTAPAIFLRAVPGSEVATFPTNLGTGGPFTLTGTLAAAPSSPSDAINWLLTGGVWNDSGVWYDAATWED